MKKLKVGVFMGGKSLEKEVSFNSGRTICDYLDGSIYDVIPIFQRFDNSLFILPWHFLHRGKISDFESRLDDEAYKINWDKLKEFVDFVYIAVHGQFAEDGTLQGFLELLKIPYLGSKVFASALSMDKWHQKIFLKNNGINVANGIKIDKYFISKHMNNIDMIIELINKSGLNLPLIVKPNKEGSSFGISFVDNYDDLYNAIINASSLNKDIYNNRIIQDIIIEEYIEGLEFSCIVITNLYNNQLLPLSPTEIVKDSLIFDYNQKYMPGKSVKYTPARLNSDLIKKIQDYSKNVMSILDLHNIARIDGFLKNNGDIVITDPNSLSGMGPSSFLFKQASQSNIGNFELINHLINTELKYYNINLDINYNKTEDKQSRMKIAILMGGNSNERDISLESGRNVFYKLDPTKYIKIPIFVDNDLNLYKITEKDLISNSTKEIIGSQEVKTKILWSDLPFIADFVFIALHGGDGENGNIQGALEMLNIPYNGSSVFTNSLCINKYRTNQYLKSLGFNTPQSMLISKLEFYDKGLDNILSNIQFPKIVKPYNDGCSFFVEKVDNYDQLIQAINNIFDNGKDYLMIEDFIDGDELTVGVIGNYNPIVLPASRVIKNSSILSIEEKFLPGAGENQTPANISLDEKIIIEETLKDIYKKIDCKGYARFDCFLKDKKLIIIEINTLPALTPATCLFHQASEVGIKPKEFIDLIIDLGLAYHRGNYDQFPKNIGYNKLLTIF